MDPYKTTSDSWNKIATRYEEVFMDLELYNDTYTGFCDLLPMRGASLLEIGCGPGNITRYMLSERPDFKILGIDIAPNMIKLAQQHNPTAAFKVLDCRLIHTLNPGYHGIICGFCIPYLSQSDCATLLRNCSNLLYKDGVMYLSFVEGDPQDSGFITDSDGNSMYFNYHSLDEIQKEFKKNNIKTIQIIKKEYVTKKGNAEIHTVVLAKK